MKQLAFAKQKPAKRNSLFTPQRLVLTLPELKRALWQPLHSMIAAAKLL